MNDMSQFKQIIFQTKSKCQMFLFEQEQITVGFKAELLLQTSSKIALSPVLSSRESLARQNLTIRVLIFQLQRCRNAFAQKPEEILSQSLSLKVDYFPGDIHFRHLVCYPVMPCTYTHPSFPRVFPSIVCLSVPRCISERKLKLLELNKK